MEMSLQLQSIFGRGPGRPRWQRAQQQLIWVFSRTSPLGQNMSRLCEQCVTRTLRPDEKGNKTAQALQNKTKIMKELRRCNRGSAGWRRGRRQNAIGHERQSE